MVQQKTFLSYLLLSMFVVFKILSLLRLQLKFFPGATALIVTAPSGASDYRQLASLVVGTFDAPLDPEFSNELMNADRAQRIRSKLEYIQWNLYEKSLTEEFTYKQYTSNVKKMWGAKYCVFLAKEHVPGNEENGFRSTYDVVGMVEMGMSVGPVALDVKEDIEEENLSQDEEHMLNDELELEEAAVFPHESTMAISSTCTKSRASRQNSRCHKFIGLRPRATVGVLCVKASHQNKGIGRALIQKCEETAMHLWKKMHLFVDVEPDNPNAIAFFERNGYDYLFDETGNKQQRDATVSKRRKSESRPHFILEKQFNSVTSEEGEL